MTGKWYENPYVLGGGVGLLLLLFFLRGSGGGGASSQQLAVASQGAADAANVQLAGLDATVAQQQLQAGVANNEINASLTGSLYGDLIASAANSNAGALSLVKNSQDNATTLAFQNQQIRGSLASQVENDNTIKAVGPQLAAIQSAQMTTLASISSNEAQAIAGLNDSAAVTIAGINNQGRNAVAGSQATGNDLNSALGAASAIAPFALAAFA